MNYPTQILGDTTLLDSFAPQQGKRPVKVLDVLGYNNGAACFVMIFETQTGAAPANGTKASFSFPAQANLGWSLGDSVDLAGIVVAYSTTPDTLTVTNNTRGTIQIIIKQ